MKKQDVDKMTVQEAVDFAVKKIVEQGGRCVDNGSCLYGYEDKHCAVGWLLDEEDDELMEAGGGVIDMSDGYADTIPDLITDNLDVFIQLQGFHDYRSKDNRVVRLDSLNSLGIDTSGEHFQQWTDMGETYDESVCI